MFYRLLYIILLNVLLSQSFFNKSIGNEIGFQSARSYAIGQTHFINSNTSVLALRNPARLGFLNIDKTKLLSLRLKLDYNFSSFIAFMIFKGASACLNF